MIWHLFRKDVRLLWPMALAVGVAAALCAMRTTMLGFFDQPRALDRLTAFLPILVALGIAIVAVMVVHQEPLSGPQEDWLIRPIRRSDLALSKVLFVLLMVNVPLLLIDVAQQVALHFPLSVSIEAAVYRSVVVVFCFSLPALMLGVVTRSLADAFVFGIAAAIGFVFVFMFATAALNPALFEIGGQAGMQAGMMWVSVWATGLVVAIGAVATLAFQYSTRRTLMARGIGLAVMLAAMCTFMFLPRTVVMRIQESLWESSPGDATQLRFDPTARLAGSAAEMTPSYVNGASLPSSYIAARAAEMARIGKQMGSIRLPLGISGLHAGDILLADRVAVRIQSMPGKVLYEGAGVCTRGGSGVGVTCTNNALEIWSSTAAGSAIASEQRLNLPIAVYERIKNDPVRVEIMYALTRLAPQPSQAIAAIGGRRSLAEVGSCATRIDDDADEIQLGCLTNVEVPSCADVVLEDPQTNRRNPEFKLCNPSYGPAHREGFEDAVSRSSLSIPFRDPSGLAHFPVDGAAIERARIVLTVYDPVNHFRRTVSIPSIRLSDWQSPTGAGSE